MIQQKNEKHVEIGKHAKKLSLYHRPNGVESMMTVYQKQVYDDLYRKDIKFFYITIVCIIKLFQLSLEVVFFFVLAKILEVVNLELSFMYYAFLRLAMFQLSISRMHSI